MHVIERNVRFVWTREHPIKIDCAHENFKAINENPFVGRDELAVLLFNHI